MAAPCRDSAVPILAAATSLIVEVTTMRGELISRSLRNDLGGPRIAQYEVSFLLGRHQASRAFRKEHRFIGNEQRDACLFAKRAAIGIATTDSFRMAS
jgi:rRNA maturation protein Rpf1